MKFSLCPLLSLCCIYKTEVLADDTYGYIELDTELLLIDCDKPNMILHSLGHGYRICYCSDGNYLKVNSRRDTRTASCRLCTECRYDRYRPYQIKKCSRYEDSVCSASPHMTSVEPDGSDSVSVQSDFVSSEENKIDSALQRCDQIGMKLVIDRNGKKSCICANGNPLTEMTDSTYVCDTIKETDDSQQGGHGVARQPPNRTPDQQHEEGDDDSNIENRLLWGIFGIVVLVLLLLTAVSKMNRSWFTHWFGNNSKYIQKNEKIQQLRP